LAASPVHAQRVQGIVLDQFTNRPVRGADVALVGERGKVVARAMTGDDGRFALSIPKFSGYHLEVNGLGYASFTTKIFFADSTQDVSAQVDLAPDAIKLEGLEVTTRAVERKLRLAGFYKREAKHVGYFIGPEEIHEKVVNRITDAFYGIPGIQVRPVSSVGGNEGWEVTARGAETQSFTGGVCLPSVLLDGVVLRNGGSALRDQTIAHVTQAATDPMKDVGTWYQLIDPSDVAAIEVYPGAAGLPVQAAGSVSPCGAILIWTKDR
jgi:hypothetical protein